MRRALLQIGFSAAVVAALALTSPRAGRTQDTRAAADVRVVNPTSAPVYTSVVNSVSSPVQSKIVNGLGAPVPANIINPATTPVQAKIVNGPASPVQTSLVGQPTVSAKQSGAWNVSVANSATNALFTREVGRPFRTGNGTANNSDFLAVPFTLTPPAGHWAVIEQVSFNLSLPDGQGIYVLDLSVPAGDGFADTHFPLTQLSSVGGSTYFAGCQQTRIYVSSESNGAAVFEAQRSSATGTFTARVGLQGRYIPVP